MGASFESVLEPEEVGEAIMLGPDPVQVQAPALSPGLGSALEEVAAAAAVVGVEVLLSQQSAASEAVGER